MPTRTFLLVSEARRVIHKFGFLFPKPPVEAQILCIATAANVYEKKDWLEEEKDSFRKLGFRLSEFDIAGKSNGEVAAALKTADIIYVTGGNTYYLQEQINRSGFAEVVKDRVRAGALYIGSSAGAVVACPTIDFIRHMDDAGAASLSEFSGMGLIDFAVLPHLDHTKYGEMARNIAATAASELRMVGLRDDQALVVRGSYVEVF